MGHRMTDAADADHRTRMMPTWLVFVLAGALGTGGGSVAGSTTQGRTEAQVEQLQTRVAVLEAADRERIARIAALEANASTSKEATQRLEGKVDRILEAIDARTRR
jgi:hypothetical protein